MALNLNPVLCQDLSSGVPTEVKFCKSGFSDYLMPDNVMLNVYRSISNKKQILTGNTNGFVISEQAFEIIVLLYLVEIICICL